MYTVCIPTTCDSSKLKSLRLTLRAIRAQSLPPEKIILSVNSKNEKNFVDSIIECFPDICVIDSSQREGNVSYARNRASEYNTSRFIIFIDNDTILGSMYEIESIMRYSHSFDFACGSKRFWAPSNWEKNIYEVNPIDFTMSVLKEISLEPINIDRRNSKQKLSNYSFIGNFGIVNAKCLEDAGGFDESFEGWGYEDTDLMQELLFRKRRFMNLRKFGSFCFHLSHYIDKSNVFDNIERYEKKCLHRGVKFHINHLFGLFENDGYKLFSEF